MARRILILDGHPDRDPAPHFLPALLDAYADGARAAGHEVERLRVATLDFPWLRSGGDWEPANTPADVTRLQAALTAADHWLLAYPLWFGNPPALLLGLLEHALRPGFAFTPPGPGAPPKPLLGGRSAHVLVTMNMPAFAYRWYFGAHGVKTLRRHLLGTAGFRPVRTTLVGSVLTIGTGGRERWLQRLGAMGTEGR